MHTQSNNPLESYKTHTVRQKYLKVYYPVERALLFNITYYIIAK